MDPFRGPREIGARGDGPQAGTIRVWGTSIKETLGATLLMKGKVIRRCIRTRIGESVLEERAKGGAK